MWMVSDRLGMTGSSSSAGAVGAIMAELNSASIVTIGATNRSPSHIQIIEEVSLIPSLLHSQRRCPYRQVLASAPVGIHPPQGAPDFGLYMGQSCCCPVAGFCAPFAFIIVA